MTSLNGNIFCVPGPLCGEFTGHRWIPSTKAIGAGRWCFLWSAPWINGWVKNREAGDLRRHRAHYDVIVIRCHEMYVETCVNVRNPVYRYMVIWGLGSWVGYCKSNEIMELIVNLSMTLVNTGLSAKIIYVSYTTVESYFLQYCHENEYGGKNTSLR